MELIIYQVDAFATHAFSGNPAAICVLEKWLPDLLMYSIAAEMNLSETAFVVPEGDNYRIRWFTPTVEVDLCGHATLAAAHVFYRHLDYCENSLTFNSRSGPLEIHKVENEFAMNFPIQAISPIAVVGDLAGALGGAEAEEILAGDDLIAVFENGAQISALVPDFNLLRQFPYRGICATAPDESGDYDFVCRFFAPASGIDEDPVTGSVYTELAPYYAKRFGKDAMRARQVSSRGGDVGIKLCGERVEISGSAVTVMVGTLHLNN